MEYKRPTQIINLPSGKKCEIITYFTKPELEDMQKIMFKDIEIGDDIMGKSEEEIGEVLGDREFKVNGSTMLEASQMGRVIAIRKLIDEDGIEYDATGRSIKDFLMVEDAEVLDKEINKLNKKKLTENGSQSTVENTKK